MNFKQKLFSLLFLFSTLLFSCNQRETVSIFAGNGKMDHKEGLGKEACFGNLMGIAVDANGNLYVADSHNNCIRKITKDGLVSTLAGSGSEGSADGKGISASFFYPEAVAVDKKGNVFVADTHNNLIRKIDSDGNVSTIAGSKDSTNKIDPDHLKLDGPTGIAVDDKGEIFVADRGNDLIRKITADGKIVNVAGKYLQPGAKDGPGDSASFYLPWGLVLDSIHNIYVTDSYNNMIRKITPEGMVTTIAGNKLKGAANGIGKSASFLRPAGIAIDKQGNLLIADMGNHKIRKINPNGLVTTFAGSGKRGSNNGADTIASFYKPYGIAIGPNDEVYIADYLNNMVRKISVE